MLISLIPQSGWSRLVGSSVPCGPSGTQAPPCSLLCHLVGQCFSLSAPVTLGAGAFLVVEAARAFQNVEQHAWPLHEMPAAFSAHSCDNPEYLQLLPEVPKGGRTAVLGCCPVCVVTACRKGQEPQSRKSSLSVFQLHVTFPLLYSRLRAHLGYKGGWKISG